MVRLVIPALFAGGTALLFPRQAFGQLDTSQFGFNIDVSVIIENVITTLQVTITPVATAIFIIGAFLYIISAEKEERRSQGKDFMTSALIGVAVVWGAKGILNLTMHFIYGQ